MATRKKKYQDGGTTGLNARQQKKIAKAQTRAKIAEIEGEGTVAQKRDNRAKRVSTMVGTARAKTPKSLSTSTSTSTSNVDNRNSGNTSNTTMSGSGSTSGATGGTSSANSSSRTITPSTSKRTGAGRPGPSRPTSNRPTPSRRPGMDRPTPRKYQDGGAPVSFKDQKKKMKQDQKLAKIQAKTDRIKAGTEPTLYEKASNITGNVAKTAGAVAETTKAISDARRGSGAASGGPGFRRGGSTRRMQNGGAMSDIKSGVKQVAKGVKKGITDSAKSAKTVVKAAVKASPEYRAYKAVGKGAKKVDDALEKRYPNYTGKGTAYDTVKKGVKSLLGYKTGGMVNPNATVKRQAVAGSRGVKAGVNPRAAASKVARGRSGGTSAAPKTAIPKKQLGGGMSAKRADKMVAKGKAVNTYSYPSMERSVTKVKRSGRGDAFVSSKDLGRTRKVKG